MSDFFVRIIVIIIEYISGCHETDLQSSNGLTCAQLPCYSTNQQSHDEHDIRPEGLLACV